MGEHVNTSRTRKCHICGKPDLPRNRSKCSPCNQRYMREYRALRSAKIQDLEDLVAELQKQLEVLKREQS